jgi:hypothetical protein
MRLAIEPQAIHMCITVHCKKVQCKTLYKYSLLTTIRAFPSEGRTTWVRRYCKGSYAYCTTTISQYVQVSTINLTGQMTRQARFPMQNVISWTRRAASLVC